MLFSKVKRVYGLAKFKYILVLLISLIPVLVQAQIPAHIVLNESTITFTGTQNNAPVTGKFKNFSGDLNFDPEKLTASSVRIVVDTNSLSTSFIDVENGLKSAEWFDVKQFPEAIFKSNSFTKTGENAYQATGDITIRGKTLPTTIAFVIEPISKTKGKAKGSFVLKRTQFGLGQGEWAITDEIKDDVQVNFAITVERKPL